MSFFPPFLISSTVSETIPFELLSSTCVWVSVCWRVARWDILKLLLSFQKEECNKSKKEKRSEILCLSLFPSLCHTYVCFKTPFMENALFIRSHNLFICVSLHIVPLLCILSVSIHTPLSYLPLSLSSSYSILSPSASATSTVCTFYISIFYSPSGSFSMSFMLFPPASFLSVLLCVLLV